MIFFHVANYRGEPMELTVHEKLGTLGVRYADKMVGTLQNDEVHQVFQYLVNRGMIDLEQILEGKRHSDKEECLCKTLRRPHCPIHFATG